MSYLEIYNENIRDLLTPDSGHLDLRDDSKGRNIQVAGLSEIATNSTEEVRYILLRSGASIWCLFRDFLRSSFNSFEVIFLFHLSPSIPFETLISAGLDD